MPTRQITNPVKPGWIENELWEYSLVTYPDKDIQEKIIKEKELFYDGYLKNVSINSRPHITIAQFYVREIMEETIIRWIQKICNLQKSFTVTLNNYSGFPAHTIYLRIQDPQPFRQLTSQLKMVDHFIQSNNCPPLQLFTNPYLAIARDLSGDVYDRAICDYAQRCFHESFKAETLMLTKRRSEYDNCQVANTFTLPPHLSLYE
jgi:2'-5' RNA ligase